MTVQDYIQAKEWYDRQGTRLVVKFEELNRLAGLTAYASTINFLAGTVVSASSIEYIGYAVSAGTLSGYGNIMTTTASQVMTNKIKLQNHSSYTSPYSRNAILSTTAVTAGACASGDIILVYIP